MSSWGRLPWEGTVLVSQVSGLEQTFALLLGLYLCPLPVDCGHSGSQMINLLWAHDVLPESWLSCKQTPSQRWLNMHKQLTSCNQRTAKWTHLRAHSLLRLLSSDWGKLLGSLNIDLPANGYFGQCSVSNFPSPIYARVNHVFLKRYITRLEGSHESGNVCAQ